ncbi:major royal jelly protein [Teratosphaeria nubilosa]|uniref:Major royal jelly protein n=1 Tax=Teratosphaeria nubilosa TaxID=161662 RepID=A0A6G1KXA6_9PEZI|nr:major royal jelly protein [Teratosphaeria nubilosa]
MHFLLHLTSLALAATVLAQTYNGPEDPRLKTAIQLQRPCSGLSTTKDGRVFLVCQHTDGSAPNPQLVEYNITTNTSTPYPNAAWNNYTANSTLDPGQHFISANAQRIGPDGKLYVVDAGHNLPYGVKVVQIDVSADSVTRIYYIGNATNSKSHLDDIRFHNSTGFAYLTDTGSPAIIILNLETGETRRVLEDVPSTNTFIPVSAEGHFLISSSGLSYVYADQLEVSPNGEHLYYQACSGGMFRIPCSALDEAFYNSSMAQSSVLNTYVEPFAHTPSTGGTAIDADGNIYCSNTDNQSVLRIYPNGTMTTLVQDPRLLWVDAMWVDSQGLLWMPCPQLNRGVSYNNGTSKIVKPLNIFTLDIGVGPPANDHP